MRPRSEWRNDDGNLVVAMGVLIVLALLSVAVVSRMTGNQNSTRQAQDYSAALANADAGVSDAMLELSVNAALNVDSLAIGTTFHSGTTGSTPIDVPFDEGSYRYSATLADYNRWTVKATGLVNGVNHSVQVELVRTADYSYAVFARDSMRFNGNQDEVFSYADGTWGWGQSALASSGNAFVATNGAIDCGGSRHAGDGQAGYVSNNCNEQRPLDEPVEVAVAERPADADSQPCPANGVFPASVNGFLGEKVFRCEAPLTEIVLSSLTVMNPPVKIWVADNVNVRVLNNANINTTAPGNSDPLNFQLDKVGAGSFVTGGGSHNMNAVGIFNMPSIQMTLNGGGHFALNGALIVSSLVVNGSDFFVAYPDKLARHSTQDWITKDWREVPT